MTCSCDIYNKTTRPDERSGKSQDEENEEKSCGVCQFKPQLEDLTPLEFVCRGPGGSISRSTYKATGKRLIVKTMKVNRRLQARIDRYDVFAFGLSDWGLSGFLQHKIYRLQNSKKSALFSKDKPPLIFFSSVE